MERLTALVTRWMRAARTSGSMRGRLLLLLLFEAAVVTVAVTAAAGLATPGDGAAVDGVVVDTFRLDVVVVAVDGLLLSFRLLGEAIEADG